jgi:hypothetical protein
VCRGVVYRAGPPHYVCLPSCLNSCLRWSIACFPAWWCWQRVVDKCCEQAGVALPLRPAAAVIPYRVFLTALAAIAFRTFGDAASGAYKEGSYVGPGGGSNLAWLGSRKHNCCVTNCAPPPFLRLRSPWSLLVCSCPDVYVGVHMRECAACRAGTHAASVSSRCDPCTQVLSLLQILDASGGKAKLNGYRSGAVVGLFNLQPVRD